MSGTAHYATQATIAWVSHTDWGGVEDQVVAVAWPDGAPMVFTDSAAAIWRAASAGGTGAEIAARVGAEVGVAPAEIANDVQEFLNELVSLGFLVRSER